MRKLVLSLFAVLLLLGNAAALTPQPQKSDSEGCYLNGVFMQGKACLTNQDGETVTTVDFLARGGYNSVWLASCHVVCQERFQQSPYGVTDIDQ